MKGLHVASYYNGNTMFVPVFFQNRLGVWFRPNNERDYKLHRPSTGRPCATKGMETVAPELLAFWSEEE